MIIRFANTKNAVSKNKILKGISYSPHNILVYFSLQRMTILFIIEIICDRICLKEGLMKNILITGGAGFIGSHLSEKLLEQGNHVLCLDNFFTGSRKNVEHLMDNKEFELIRHDIIEPIILEVDQIYNLACPASPIHYQYNAD